MNTQSTTESDLIGQRPLAQLSPAELAEILNALDVPFVQAGGCPFPPEIPEPADLLVSLIACDEARLRSALIPLLLRHPEFAQDAASAAGRLSASYRFAFICFYTAAALLQRKHASRLTALGIDFRQLPHLFSVELSLLDGLDQDEALRRLAARHRALSGKAINWLGTYEHAAERWLTHMEHRRVWAA